MKLENSKIIQKSKQYFLQYKRFLPVVAFITGFAWDSFTLTRIDLWSDNLILLSYLLLLGVMIILVNLINDQIITSPFILRFRTWYLLSIQFFLGGLFSSYVVFYFKSSALSKNWIFLLLLIVILIGNEFIENRLMNLKLQFSLFFFATFSFFIFFVPVLIKVMNSYIFIISGIMSLAWVIVVLYFIYKKSTRKTSREIRMTLLIIAFLFLLLNIFYFLNWIPPVPLALKEGGIYHHVSRKGDYYLVKYESGSWYHFWKRSDDIFHYRDGDSVFCFTAVFAPTRLNKQIVHHWQNYDKQVEDWISTDRMAYRIIGGRDGGYRGYSFKRNLQEGKWRVDVQTPEGQLLGRVSFNISRHYSGDYALRTKIR